MPTSLRNYIPAASVSIGNGEIKQQRETKDACSLSKNMKMKTNFWYRLLVITAISVWSVLIVVAAQRVGLVWKSTRALGWGAHEISFDYVEESPENLYFERLNSTPEGREKARAIGRIKDHPLPPAR